MATKKQVDYQQEIENKTEIVKELRNSPEWVDNKQKIKQKANKVDNQQNRHFVINNNKIAVLAIIFVLASIFLNYRIYHSVESQKFASIGKVTDESSIGLCLNARPYFSESCHEGAGIGVEYYCKTFYSDRDNVSITFSDNTTFFDINESGEIRFTPLASDDGWHAVKLNMQDGSGCRNENASINFTIVITNCEEPTWNEFKNNLTTNFSRFSCWHALENVTIGVLFNATINFTGNTLNLNGVNLDEIIDLKLNNITVYSNLESRVNKSSTNKLFSLSLVNPEIYIDGQLCPSNICNRLSYGLGTLTFNVSHFTTYTTSEGAEIGVWDTTDNTTKYTRDNITFYAGYIYSSGTPISDGFCNISINLTGDNYSEITAMRYNATSGFFEYKQYFDLNTQGKRGFIVLCNDSDSMALNASSTFNISNRAPVQIATMPNETWNEDTELTGRDLDDYFIDPDGDELNFSNTPVENILISIRNDTHRITLTPDENFYGTRYVIYRALDQLNAFIDSNIVALNVIDVPEAAPETTPSAAGGGGGGGGSSKECIEKWECQAFGLCLPAGIKTRDCVDLARCKTELRKPEVSAECEYIPTCYDLIKNGEETGVDCGGYCPPCPSCSDGIKNQGEEGIDCGGLCKPCASCSDKIQNQDETGIDCGGVCPACGTCDDGIQSPGEEGIDCGGVCTTSCQEKAKIESPARKIISGISSRYKSIIWWIIIAIISAGIVSTIYKNRQSIASSIKKNKVISDMSKARDKNRALEKEVLAIKKANELAKRAIAENKSLSGEREISESYEALNSAFNYFLLNSFNISGQVTEKDIKDALHIVKLKEDIIKEIVNFRNDIEKKKFSESELKLEDYNSDIRIFEKIISDITKILDKHTLTNDQKSHVNDDAKSTLKEAKSQEKSDADYKTNNSLDSSIAKCEDYLNSANLKKAKEEYKIVLKYYKKLNDEDKKKIFKEVNDTYRKIKDLETKDSQSKELSDKSTANKKIISAIILIMLVGSLGFLMYTTPGNLNGIIPTGLAIFKSNNLIDGALFVDDIADQYIIAGEELRFEVSVSSARGKVVFASNNPLYKIDSEGTIVAQTNEKFIGKHRVVIIIEDESETFVAKGFWIHVFADEKAQSEYMLEVSSQNSAQETTNKQTTETDEHDNNLAQENIKESVENNTNSQVNIQIEDNLHEKTEEIIEDTSSIVSEDLDILKATEANQITNILDQQINQNQLIEDNQFSEDEDEGYQDYQIAIQNITNKTLTINESLSNT